VVSANPIVLADASPVFLAPEDVSATKLQPRGIVRPKALGDLVETRRQPVRLSFEHR